MRRIINKTTLTTIAAVLLATSLTACGSDAGQTSGGTTQDGVTTVKVAFDQNYAPYDFVDENGNADGYEIAVLKAVDELLPQYEFVYTGTTNDDLLIGVESGKYDVGTKGVWWTADRSLSYVFPEHYIGTSIVGLMIRTEDADRITDMESFARESGKLVPLAPQNAQYTIVENYNKNHPDNQINLIAADQWSSADTYQWVKEGRYDASFTIKTSFEANVIAESGEYHDYVNDFTFITYEAIPTWPLFNIKNQELADAYDEAWQKLYEDGTLEALAQQYFGYSLFEMVPEGYRIGDEL